MSVVTYLRRPRWFRALVFVMAFVVIDSLLSQLPAAAEVVALDRVAHQHDASVPGARAGKRALPADPAEQKAVHGTPSARTWPKAGTAVVDVPKPATGTVRAAATAVRAKAGSLPVSIGAAAGAAPSKGLSAQAAAASPGRVRVDLLGRRGDGLLMRVNRADGVTSPGRVSLEVDYSAFRDTFGGDWATRLRLVSLPECAATTPDKPQCVGVPVGTVNNGSGRLSGDVPVGVPGMSASQAGSSGLFAVMAASSGSAGDFGASSMSPSATWQAGGPSGDFTWSYPMSVPPALGGPTPELTLGYSSGDVDGRTTGTNNQPSWVGEGFEFTPGGYVERRYTPCSEDMKAQGSNKANNTTKTGDLCWGTDNLVFSINGRGGELVRDDATGAWHPKVDDGSRVEHLTDTSLANGDDDGEYWRITSRDGVQYYFGRNKLPGWATGNPTTQSVWTVPVFGNHAGEPCYKSTFDASYCNQAWRWNLDYVVDPHGNTMSLFYQQEKNNYARDMTASKVSSYVRGGYLEHIEYGQRDGSVYTTPWIGRVLFTVKDRCIPGTTCTTSQPANWPDVPWDQNCASTTSCNNHFDPTFWTQKRLDSVKTQVWGGSAPRDVDQWTMTQTYPDPGDGTKPRLWLASLQHTGLVNGSMSLPAVTFAGVQMPNRVDGTDHIPPLNWWRLKSVRTEGGDSIAVSYSGQECNYSSLPAPDTNGLRCDPVRWTPDGLPEQTDWFNKYVVTQVTESDQTTAFEPEVSDITYVGPAAWHHDDEDGMVPEDRKTWSQWRGYETVRVRKGVAGEPRSLTEMHFFRGMDGDETSSGAPKSVKFTDSAGNTLPDADPFAGAPRETITYTGDGGTELSRTVTDPWLSAPTATRVRSWGTTSSYEVQEKKVVQTETQGGQSRQTATTHTYDTGGALLTEYQQNDLADPSDDTCTHYSYARNTSAWLMEVPSEERTTVGPCDRQPTSAQDIVSDERLYYDNSDTLGSAPVRGDLTRREEISDFTGGVATYQTSFRAAYDAYGRVIDTSDAYGRHETTTYDPANGPETTMTATNALGQQSVTQIEPAWGAELSTVTPAGLRTTKSYDPLGRMVKEWDPGSDPNTPNTKYSYLVRTDAPSVIITSTLDANGNYRTEYQLLDGKMRLRQTQSPSPNGGRVVTDSVYNSLGQKVKENGPYYNDAPPGTDLLIPDETRLPAQTVTQYDGAGRPTSEAFNIEGVEQWRTTYVNAVDHQDITPPLGDTPTTRVLDAQGRLVELRQYKGAAASGPYDSTKYTYWPSGQLATVTDPAGNVTRYTYDLQGRRTKIEDPDQGTTTFTYGADSEVQTVTDSRGVTLAYEYDSLGRKTAVHKGSLTGPVLSAWTYDRLPDGTAVPGLPVSTTQYSQGRAFTTSVTKYDANGQVGDQTLTVPAGEGSLSNVYDISYTYRPDGEPDTTTLPAVGGLPKETLRYGYDSSSGMPTTLAGATTYVTGAQYTDYGEEAHTDLSAGGKGLHRDFTYDEGTRRLHESSTNRDTGPSLISDVTYQYDDAGNIVKMTDAPDPATGSATDTQCFRTDYLRRLTAAWTPASGDCSADPTAGGLGGPAPYWESWTFDVTGNRKTQTRTNPDGTSVTTTYNYNAPGSAQPHALQSTTTTTASGSTTEQYGYDPSGNLQSHSRAAGDQTLTWDDEGNLASVTANGKTTSYAYDVSGNLLLRRDPTGSTLYLGDTELRTDSAGNLTGTRYYEFNDHTIGMRNGSTGKLTWLVTDQHGTAELAVDEATQSVQRQRHDPYGNTRGTGAANLAGDRGFVGGIVDDTTGLTTLGVREYDASLGRFISVDPEIDPTDPQQMNGYSYANNSPVSFTDPDGRAWVTKTVTSWRTVYRTVIRKVVQTIMVLVTLFVLLISLLTSMYAWHPITLLLVKTIVRYIKTIQKQIIKITRVLRVFVRTHSVAAAHRLAHLTSQLDAMRQSAIYLAQSAYAFLLATAASREPEKKDSGGHHRSFWGKVGHAFAAVGKAIYDNRGTIGKWLAVGGLVACVIATDGICAGVAYAGAAFSITMRGVDFAGKGGYRKASGYWNFIGGTALDITLARVKSVRSVGRFTKDRNLPLWAIRDPEFRPEMLKRTFNQISAYTATRIAPYLGL
jgi:RHS repeat-associated protein